jgi:hypothetical protein
MLSGTNFLTYASKNLSEQNKNETKNLEKLILKHS